MCLGTTTCCKLAIMNKAISYYLMFINVSMVTAKGLLPGTFYWRPRLGAFGYSDKTGSQLTMNTVTPPTTKNIRSEFVILIDGYSLGLTVISLSAGYYVAEKPFLHLHPKHVSYYTNAYRWGLRHFSLIAPWLGGSGKYIDTHKVWRRRFFYMEEFVPKWLRRFTPWIEKEEWESEEDFMRFFKFYAEPAFGKHYRYPGKQFVNFKSQETEETMENMDVGWKWVPKPRKRT